ncbi:MDR family MFS transporter [Pedobacter sp. PLR]|uniref:MDR family MFS transporter n=1 Tax=Pedobacter sp. PLR TaxID=2994465 RepID=UPI002247B762|nr:MDR family MFS transporter [Pedobacter sp. PLR]MCX2451410.1 MDR family MFS transporter [Pedobacter sp. PLR]
MMILTGILLAMFLGALDQTIVSAAVPQIVADLHGMDRFVWITTAYLMASTALIPIYGKLADIYSRKAIELTSVCVFLLGSCLCGFAGQFNLPWFFGDGMTQLILARGIQGLGGAGLFAMAFVIIADLFSPAERGRFQGYTGAVFAVASILGPMLGGFLTDHGSHLISGMAGWRLVFFINLPFGLIALIFITRQMPALLPVQQNIKLDRLSALLLITGIGTFVLAIQSSKGIFGKKVVVILFVGALSILLLFMIRSRLTSNPLLNFGLFKNRVFRPASIAIFLLGGAFFGIIIFEPLFMVNVLGQSATRAGIGLVPLSLGIVCTSMLSGRMVSKYGHYKFWMLGGLILLSLGLMLLIRVNESVSYARLLCYLAICGLGIGPSMALYTLAVQNATDRHLIGQATSACQFSRQIGGLITSAMLGVILTLSIATAQFSTSASAYTNGIANVYDAILVLVIASFMVTLKIPEIPLSKRSPTNYLVKEGQKEEPVAAVPNGV